MTRIPFRASIWVAVLNIALNSFAAADGKARVGADSIPAGPKATLEAAGLKVTPRDLTLPDEREMGKLVHELTTQKKGLKLADRKTFAAQKAVDDVIAQFRQLTIRLKDLNSQLAKVNDAISNNRIVGALNVTKIEIGQMEEKLAEAAKKLKEAKGEAAALRDQYVRDVSAARSRADEIDAKWMTLRDDRAVTDALREVNQSLGTTLALQPGSSFGAKVKTLRTMEAAITAGAIPLENEEGGLWVGVKVNDEHTTRMIVDSGATTISLPAKTARDMGINVDGEGIPTTVGLADGRRIPAWMVKLESVRVGPFTLDDVDCCVLSPDAVDAPPLLGMSFLGQFKFEIDASRSELKMVKVDSGERMQNEEPKGRKKTKPGEKKPKKR